MPKDRFMFAKIQEKLQVIAEEKAIRFLFVAESGSRAWGFASTDSDYDVRGIYVQSQEAYLCIQHEEEGFDWIENDWFDVGAWDIRKTLRLLSKSNAVVLEWLQSPIVYQTGGNVQQALLDLAQAFSQPRHLLYHYRGIAKTASSAFVNDAIRLKKWFYIIRPLLAARWVVKEGGIAPMTLAQLQTQLPIAEQTLLTDLVAFKEEQSEDYVWQMGRDYQQLLTRLWDETQVELPMKDVPNIALLDEWFRTQL